MLTRYLLGLTLHSALDQVQAALLAAEGLGWGLRAELVQFHQEPVPPDAQALLLTLVAGSALEPRQLGLAHRVLGELLAAAALHAADRANFSLANLLAVGLDGLVAWHDADGAAPTQLHLGAAALVAERTGITVVSDFAGRDLACQGQGTPLHALPHFLLFHHRSVDRAVLSIRDWTEVTLLPHGARPEQARGGLAGPGMWFLDGLVQQLTKGQERTDPGGRHAVQGRLIPELLQRWLHHPLLLRRPPRSAPRSLFGAEYVRQTIRLAEQQGWSAHDLLCTAHHLVVAAATQSLNRWAGVAAERPAELILCGPGSRNGLLWRLLEEQLPGWKLCRSDDHGWPAAAVAASCTAVLAALTLDGEPANLPAVTGARGPRLLGQITPGSMANWSACLEWMTGRWEVATRQAA
jgi:anhydro-N-acetylmuramic acid kinase